VRLEVEFPDGTVCKLGHKELGILSFLHDNPGVVITRKAIIHAVWGLHANVRCRSLDQYIAKARVLFTSHGIDFLAALHTVHGVGYLFDPEKAAADTEPPQAALPSRAYRPSRAVQNNSGCS
jgi:DNA-binding response OmpR family regulator